MSVNQQLKPITAKRNGNLFIGGCDLVELAKKYGTPLYVIDEESLREICREYIDAFKNYPNIKMMYASKALCSLATSKIISQENFGFDTVSAGEIYTVYKAGVDMSTVLFNGNNKTRREIELALELKVGRFSVDNFFEAELLNKIAQEKGVNADILLRITPGIECHTHEYIQTGQIDSKFGFDLSEIDEIIQSGKMKREITPEIEAELTLLAQELSGEFKENLAHLDKCKSVKFEFTEETQYADHDPGGIR